QLYTLLLVFERLKLQVETGWAFEFDRDSGRCARDCYARRLSAGIRLISDCGQGIAKGGRMCRPVRRPWIDRNVNLSGGGTVVLRPRRVGDEQMLASSRRRHRSGSLSKSSMHGTPFAQRFDKRVAVDARVLLEDGVLGRLLAGAGEIGMAKRFRGFQRSGPVHLRRVEERQPGAHDLFRDVRRWQAVFDHGIETAEQGPVQDLRMVGRAYDDTVGVILFQKLQERVQHPTYLADLILGGAFAPQSVEFIEEVYRPRLLDRLENQSQLGGGLSQIAGNQPVELDREEGNAQLAGQRRGGHRLSGARRAKEQQLADWRHAVSPDAFPLALLQEDALKTRANGVVKRHVGQTDRREGGRQKPCKLAARLHDRNGLRPLSG